MIYSTLSGRSRGHRPPGKAQVLLSQEKANICNQPIIHNLPAAAMDLIDSKSQHEAPMSAVKLFSLPVDTALASASPFYQLHFPTGRPLLWDPSEA